MSDKKYKFNLEEVYEYIVASQERNKADMQEIAKKNQAVKRNARVDISQLKRRFDFKINP